MDSYEFLEAQRDEILRARREKIAEMIYDWLHEAQITHRKRFVDRDEAQKNEYRALAAKIMNVCK